MVNLTPRHIPQLSLVPVVHCKDWCMHRYQTVNIPSTIFDQVTDLHVTDHYFGVWAHFIPLMFLQGPYFSTWRFLGLSKAKSWWEHCCPSSHPSQPSHLSHPSNPSHLHHPCHSIILSQTPLSSTLIITLIILASQPLLPHAVILVPQLST